MKKPNVLLICTDHWPGRLLGCAGHPVIMTPTLDTLAASGVRFTRAYSGTPTCIPARREIMTGTSARTHGDRIFNEELRMDPKLTTLPQAFRHAGYQTFSVGKLHLFPQRSRIGFDDALICEEGRHKEGLTRDDYEIALSDAGYHGREFGHCMSNNEYSVSPWHLPDELHPTAWITRQMCRQIVRRDPERPAFWHCSYPAPHPPITPPRDCLALYPESIIDDPSVGSWAEDFSSLPYALKAHKYRRFGPPSAREIRLARAGFYAQCTFIDRQIRLLIGTLREEGLLDETIIAFISDHGDMLGEHGLWAKPPLFEMAANVPFIISALPGEKRLEAGAPDDRLILLQDLMPTLLDLCRIPVPVSVEGISLLGRQRRSHICSEHYEDEHAVRMVRDSRYKLIYYPCGNRFQLFDLVHDPGETEDRLQDSALQGERRRLEELLLAELYGSDLSWIRDGRLCGTEDRACAPAADRGLTNQRGYRW